MRKISTKARGVSLKAVNAKVALVAETARAVGTATAQAANIVDAAMTAAKACPSTAKTATEMVRDEYKAGHIAQRLMGNRTWPVALAAGREVMAMANATGTGKLKKGQKRRNPEQEAAYKAAGVAWSRILAMTSHAPVKAASNGNKGKKRKVEQKAAPAPKLPKNVLPFIPPAKVENKQQFVTYVQGAMAALLTRCESVNQTLMRTRDETLPIGVTDAIAAAKSAIDELAKKMG